LRADEGGDYDMLLLIALAVIAIALFGVGLGAVHFLLYIAAIVALIWVIALLVGGVGRPGWRRW
jgi:hypothetical protein